MVALKGTWSHQTSWQSRPWRRHRRTAATTAPDEPPPPIRWGCLLFATAVLMIAGAVAETSCGAVESYPAKRCIGVRCWVIYPLECRLESTCFAASTKTCWWFAGKGNARTAAVVRWYRGVGS